MVGVRVADEVWIATALLHRQHPDRDDFAVQEIVRRAEVEKVTGDASLRPGVQVHAYLHCVANKAPNPGRYRMLVETAKGRRRLYKPGDPCHRLRAAGKDVPDTREIPPAYGELLDWYRRTYVGAHDRGDSDPILALRGVGKAIWAREEADSYVDRLRAGWR